MISFLLSQLFFRQQNRKKVPETMFIYSVISLGEPFQQPFVKVVKRAVGHDQDDISSPGLPNDLIQEMVRVRAVYGL